jgi:hypothetical protein
MRRLGWLIVPIILVVLLGLAVFGARGPNPATAFTLQPGNCFDVPGDAQVGDIPLVDCSQPHDAEAFVAVAVNGDAPSGPEAYPGASAIGEWVANHCGSTVVSAYAGSASDTLAVGYFYPDETAWARGERRLTCYLHSRDGSKLTAPLGTVMASASPS